MTECYGDALVEAIGRGLIAREVVDEAARRVLDGKFRLGLFERPLVTVDVVMAHTRTPEQIELAHRVAQDSLVLLCNDDSLPLSPSTTSIAVIGPNAADARNMVGDYSYVVHIESLLEVLQSGRNVFAMPLEAGLDVDQIDLGHIGTVVAEMARRWPDTTIVHERGCDVLSEDRSGFEAAVAAAAAADVAVMVMGERSGLTDDCTTGESRDVAELKLPGVQEELVLAVAATGTPVVLVLVAGRPIGSPAVHEAAAAVMMAWLPGECGPAAIADALVGRASPGGKLPISYPRSSGQIPVFHSHKVSGGRSHWKGEYVDMSNEPLYPFGHGLSYSTFELEVEALHGDEVRPGDTVTVSATLTNSGQRRADEVVQLYSRDPVASITRAVQELQGFVRVTLDPGESTRVGFELPVDALGFTGRDLVYVVEPGDIELMVGTSTDDLRPAGHIVIVGDRPHVTTRAMTSRAWVEPI
jgi:beta-glucosidase